MPRKRNPENKGLPSRWRKKHGAIYYQVPEGMEQYWDGKKLFRLGKTEVEAYREWSARIGFMDRVKTIGQLLERYEREVIPEKAPKTRNENIRYSMKLRSVFGHMPIASIKPQHIYQYVDKRSKKVEDEEGKVTGGLVIARREVALLSHAYTKAVQWGLLPKHPFKGEVRLKGEQPRKRYVEDWEVMECLSIDPARAGDSIKVIHAYIILKIITGLRQGDLLMLKTEDLREDGIHVTPRKTESRTQRKIIITWTPTLHMAIDAALAVRPAHSAYVFATRRGESYYDSEKGEASGWKSMWHRFMKRVLDETKVKERFTEHDLRAKTGSDKETLQEASQMLGHSSLSMTQRTYRRKPEKVQPAEWRNSTKRNL